MNAPIGSALLMAGQDASLMVRAWNGSDGVRAADAVWPASGVRPSTCAGLERHGGPDAPARARFTRVSPGLRLVVVAALVTRSSGDILMKLLRVTDVFLVE